MKRYLILELELSKDIPDLADKIAGRAWTLDGVEDANIKAIWTESAANVTPQPVGHQLSTPHILHIGRKYFGNPTPKAWFDAARDLEKANGICGA